MKKTLQLFRRTGALALVLVLLLSLVPVGAQAAQANTPKEEVVYVNLNADGSMKDVTVVNIFEMETPGKIHDYGKYSELRNMTSTAPIRYENDKVTIDAQSGKLYYEGKLENPVLPWNIAVRYFMDGKEYSAQKIAGMSGALMIQIDVTRNEQSQTNFFDAFALQVTLSLDTAKCSNIVAPDATMANVGSSKQLTHTLLPGKESHLQITADVVDFAMDGISINGIPLNLNVEVDSEALMGQLTELVDAIGQLDDGAESLKAGISSLQSGAKSKLASGVDSLYEGAQQMNAGATELQNGGSALNSGAKELSEGATALDEGIQTLNDGVIRLQGVMNLLNIQKNSMNKNSAAHREGLTKLQAAVSGLSISTADLTAMADSSAQVLAGLTELVNSTQALQDKLGTAAWKAAIAQSGVSVDSLKQNNSAIMAALRASIDANSAYITQLQEQGIDITGMISQMESAISALGNNNVFIDATGNYLDSLSGAVTPYVEQAVAMKEQFAALDSQVSALSALLGTLPSQLSALNSAVNDVVSQYSKVENSTASYTGAVAEIISAYGEVVQGVAALAEGSAKVKTGADDLYAGTGELLTGISQVRQGAGKLETGSGQLSEGVEDLLDGIAAVYAGSKRLESGTTTMQNETAGMDTMVSDKVDSMLADITGAGKETGSFVSEANTDVRSVQFVIQTTGIHNTGAIQQTVSEAQPATFWQKLLALFGL